VFGESALPFLVPPPLVSWRCQVWLNHHLIGGHRGDYDAFSFDVTRELHRQGQNELIVGYTNPIGTEGEPVGKQAPGTPAGITTVYNLLDMNGTPYTLADDTLIATSGALFANSNAVDKGPLYRGNQSYGGGSNGSGSADCQSSPYHNSWWRLATGLTEGQYRLQVTTSSGTTSEDAINAFGIQATAASGPSARVYGQSRMEAFIVINNTSVFYLAQIEAAHAGKTLEIKLFDPGDISDTVFKIRLPTATGFVYPSFTFSTTGSGCGAPTSGGPTTQLRTSDSSGCRYYNNEWVTISVPIPATYTAPTPPGEPGPGWFKIEYNTLGTGQDITTWEVNIRGNPVHLITP